MVSNFHVIDQEEYQRTNLTRSRVRNASIIKQLHPNGITSSNVSNLRLGGIAERAQVAAEVGIVGGQIVEGLGELGGHVVLLPSSLADVLPVLGDLVVQHELAEDVVRRSGMGQHSGDSQKACKMLHVGEKENESR